MTVVVRPIRPEEYATVGELTVAAYAATGQLGGDGADSYGPTLRDVAARVEVGEVLVAVDAASGQPLGTVTFVQPGTALAEVSRPGEAEFRMLAVDPAAQGRGAGEALVRACIERARDTGAGAIVLCTRDVAGAAHRLYDRLGFVRTPERDWYPRPDLVLMALRLPL